jgi:hypothetical protein
MPRTRRFTASVAVACVAAALGMGTAHGCGETIEVPGGGSAPKRDPSAAQTIEEPGGGSVDQAAPIPPPPSLDIVVPEGPAVESTAQSLTECGSGGAGGIAGGGVGGLAGGALAACGASTSVRCFDNGRGVRATITPLDCDSAGAGFIGDPARVQVACEEALDGQSGERCQGFSRCGRAVQDSCCAHVVACKADSSLLRRYRACPSPCLVPTSKGNVSVTSCQGLAALWRIDSSEIAWLGARCAGQFFCSGPDAQLGDIAPLLYYCGNGALQMVPFFVPGP